MTVKANPMSTQRGIRLKVPKNLRSRVEACARVQRPWLPNCVRAAIVAGCAGTERRLGLQGLRACQDNSA